MRRKTIDQVKQKIIFKIKLDLENKNKKPLQKIVNKKNKNKKINLKK